MIDRQDIMKEGQHTTKCICHKGFRKYSSVVARSNIRVGGQETTTQSLTAHTLDRYGQVCGQPHNRQEKRRIR